MGTLLEGNAIDDPSVEPASIINALDASLLAAAINEQKFDPRVDFNRDGKVDNADLELLKKNYLRFSPFIIGESPKSCEGRDSTPGSRVCVTFPHPAAIFPKCPTPHTEQAIFNPPVATHSLQKLKPHMIAGDGSASSTVAGFAIRLSRRITLVEMHPLAATTPELADG